MLTITEVTTRLTTTPSGSTTLAWMTATDEARQQGLTYAINAFDSLLWRGELASTSQDHAWPRTGTDCQSRPFPQNAVPRPVTQALSLMAAYAVQQAETLGTIEPDESSVHAGSIKRLTEKVDTLEQTFEYYQGAMGLQPNNVVPARLLSRLKCYLSQSSLGVPSRVKSDLLSTQVANVRV